MKLSEIKATVKRVAGIGELNPMQATVAVSDAARIVLLSPTGSGKTLAYVIAVLRRLKPAGTGERCPRAVIIAPSRELVRQIYDVMRPIAAAFSLKTTALYGGNAFAAEESSLRGATADILVATPGRLLDHTNRGTVDLGFVQCAVLDEYDKILELGFQDEMSRIARRIGSAMPGGTSPFVMATSATSLAQIPGFIDLVAAETIDYTDSSNVARSLRIVNVPSPGRDKLETLAALVRSISDGPIIVFVNHRESADRVGAYLDKQKISNVVYHGGLEQQHREMALDAFAADAARVLVATDLAGRGIDVEAVRAVIHYHLPPQADVWTHRNGRTARVDRNGEVYVITGPDENIPDFVVTENDYYPDMTATGAVTAPMSLIYINRGKRDKISRGDIAGFVMKQAGVPADAVGRIVLGTSYAMVAVRPQYAAAVIKAADTSRLKNIRVRASLQKG